MPDRRSAIALLAAALTLPLLPARAVAEPPAKGFALIMVDRKGCIYCARWKREILPGYAENPTGRQLPLTIIPMDGPWPDGLVLGRSPYISPTFLLLKDRVEVGRIEGYPGAAYFWPEIDTLLARAKASA